MSDQMTGFGGSATRIRQVIGLLLTACLAASVVPRADGATSKVVLKLSPTAVTVAQGSSVAVTLTVTRAPGFGGSLLVSGVTARAGLSIASDQNPVSGPSTTLKVTATPAAKTGRTTLTVRVSGGGASASAKLTVTVTPAAAGAPGATPTSLVIQPGESGSVSFQTVGARTGVPVSFGAANLPTGLKVTITPAGTGARYVFTAATTTKLGPYTVTLRASQGGVVFYSSSLPISIGNPVVTTVPVTTTVLAGPASTSTPTVSTVSTAPTVQSTVAAASTSAISAQTTTSSTTTVVATGVTSTQPVVVGADLVIVRAGAGGDPLACSLSEPALGAAVTVTFFNSATSPRVMSQQAACAGSTYSETPAILTIPAGQSAVVTAKINTKYVFRSANDGGLRRAIQIQRSGLVDVGGPMTVSVACTGPRPYNATLKLAQGDRVVIADIPPGSSCAVNDIDGWQIYWKSWDNSGPNADGVVAVQQRPAGCVPATPAAPSQLNVNPPCWAEIKFSW